jgi:hypothetical protein
LKEDIDDKLAAIQVISDPRDASNTAEQTYLPKIQILQTENKGLYVPIVSLSEEQRTDLKRLLQNNGVEHKYYSSPSQGEVFVVPYTDWPKLQLTQSQIAFTIDSILSKKGNVPDDENPLHPDYHLRIAAENATAQLGNLQYLQPK